MMFFKVLIIGVLVLTVTGQKVYLVIKEVERLPSGSVSVRDR